MYATKIAPYFCSWRVDSHEKIRLVRNAGYVPRAATPLLDALGRGINDLEKSLADMLKKDRPKKVVFAVVTDGQENASREFSKKQVVKMIREKTDKDGWQFVFLSADLGAIAEAQELGVQASMSMTFAKDAAGTKGAWDSLSKNTSDFRGGVKPDMAFEEKDRKHPQDPNKKKKK